MTSSGLEPGEFLATRQELARTVPCRGCGAAMVWVQTESGRRMPLSAAKAREIPCLACGGRPGIRCTACGSAGHVFAVLNHWADCPASARFKAGKPAAVDPAPRAP